MIAGASGGGGASRSPGAGDPGGPGAGIRGYQDLVRGELRSDEARLEASAALLESEFVTTLFRTMRETLPEESPGAGQSADIFWSMMEREVADQVSMQGGYGLGDLLREALLKSRVTGADTDTGEAARPASTASAADGATDLPSTPLPPRSESP
jgi:Rod binding domain-containing protein